MSQLHILLVEDDVAVAKQIIIEFNRLGLVVVHAVDGTEGLRRGLAENYAVVLLDIELPGMNGLDICRELRAAKPLLPLMLLTSRTSQVDRVLGFELGADDYVTKPFEIQELLARVRSKIRRSLAMRESQAQGSIGSDSRDLITIGEVSIDLGRRSCTLRGEPVVLTAKEFDLLAFLMRHSGIVVSKEEILQLVWGVASTNYEEAVVAVIRRIRKKIEDDPTNPKYILTNRGVGYTFTDQIVLKG